MEVKSLNENLRLVNVYRSLQDDSNETHEEKSTDFFFAGLDTFSQCMGKREKGISSLFALRRTPRRARSAHEHGADLELLLDRQ